MTTPRNNMRKPKEKETEPLKVTFEATSQGGRIYIFIPREEYRIAVKSYKHIILERVDTLNSLTEGKK